MLIVFFNWSEYMSDLTLTSTVTLNNGLEMPVLGLGTFKSQRGDETQNAVRWALEAGYRHIDTAAVYRNEQDVGAGIRDSGIPRQELFLTSKVWNSDQGFNSTLRAFDQSLARLGTDYLDLYLVHWPIRGTRLDTWRALARLAAEGRCRAVGVSNYTVRHLKEALSAADLVPAVNQFELSPFNTRCSLVDFCQEKGIQVESYSPLARGKKLNHPTVAALAHQHGKSPAQVLIRWALEKGYVVIPKSVHQNRILENSQVFDFSLSGEEVQTLDDLNENLHTINPPWMVGEWG